MPRNKQVFRPLLAAFFAVLLATPWVSAQEEDEPEVVIDDEVRIESLASIPPKVMSAARGAAPDVAFQSVDSLWQDDLRVYRLRGRLFREVWTVHVDDTGRVLRVERDNQDD